MSIGAATVLYDAETCVLDVHTSGFEFIRNVQDLVRQQNFEIKTFLGLSTPNTLSLSPRKKKEAEEVIYSTY